MLQSCGELDLAQEPLGTQGGRELRVKYFERDGTIVLEIVRQVDGSHPAPAELAQHRVATSQSRLEELKAIRSGHVPTAYA